MTASINASTSSGVIVTSDTSGSLALQTANTTAMTINSSQVVNFANAPTIAGGALPIASGGTGLTSVGTNGQVLTSNGTSLSYTTPSAGAMTLISTQTASSSSSLSWTGLTGYNNYVLILNSLVNGGTYINLQFGTGAGPTYITSGYYLTSIEYYGGIGGTTQANQSQINLTYSSVATNLSATYNLFNFTNSKTVGLTSSGMFDATYNQRNNIKNGQVSNSSIITAVKLFPDSGSFTSGTVSLYGISS